MKYKCPCCGYYTFEKKPNGNCDICPVCFWEDDLVQLNDENYSGGANKVSLKQGRENFLLFGACERKMISHVRKPKNDELEGIARTICITKPCTEDEREYILSAIEKDDRILFYNNEKEILDSNDLENIDIILGEPELSTISHMRSLRWVQMTWAGANKYTSSEELFDNIILTNAAGAFGYVISEYIISGILALYRDLFKYRSEMKEGRWNLISEDTLEGKRALILGTGNIGQETAKRLKCFGAYTVGMSRTSHDKKTFFDELYTIENLDNQLESADLVIISLPGTKETRGMFDAERISRMKKSALLVNVGRGFVVNTEALTDALMTGKIRGAVLDVTEPEPLPEKHPLRHMENVVLTPHISGISWGKNMFTRKRILDIFCENLKRDKRGERLNNIIDFSKGY